MTGMGGAFPPGHDAWQVRRVRGLRIFLWAPRNHVVDATTRSDTTCSRRWGQTTDLSARLADSASQAAASSPRF